MTVFTDYTQLELDGYLVKYSDSTVERVDGELHVGLKVEVGLNSEDDSIINIEFLEDSYVTLYDIDGGIEETICGPDVKVWYDSLYGGSKFEIECDLLSKFQQAFGGNGYYV